MLKVERSEQRKLAFNGYHRRQTAEPDLDLCQVGRGTAAGEYHRRFWQPICYLSELGEVPLRIRALGEDLVAFKDLRGRIGVLHLHCCHRNSSLEYGVITDKGNPLLLSRPGLRRRRDDRRDAGGAGGRSAAA